MDEKDASLVPSLNAMMENENTAKDVEKAMKED